MIFSKVAIPAIMAFTSVTSAATTFSNMLFIILENTDYSSAIADPNLKSFASSGVLFSNWDAIGHPSQPNYIAITSGSTNGVTSDSTITINVKNVADLLEAKGLTWKDYQENWPGNCFTGTESTDGLYFRLVNHFHHCTFIKECSSIQEAQPIHQLH
jgi:Phosphoesterase family